MPREPNARRLLVAVGAVVFLDTMFFAVIAPLLPELTHQLHLSKLSAGVMTACYPIGTLAAALPGGLLAMRAGPRVAVGTGLVLLAGSSIAFGFAHTAAGLDAARVAEGVGGACSWAGALGWIVAATPVARRGSMIGRALSAAVAGSLFGPAIGALATVTGRPLLFCTLAICAAVLITVTRRLPDPGRSSEDGLAALRRVARRPAVRLGMWLMLVPAIVSGMVNVLGPLRLHRFGAGAGVIGATFLAAAALEAATAPAIGTLSDRRGRLVPLRIGLSFAVITLVGFTAPATTVLLSLLIIVITCTLGAFWTPAMALLSDAAEVERLDQGLAAGLINLAWAGGLVIGSGGGGAIAKSSGDALPTLAAAALCALTLAGLTLTPVRGRMPR